MSKLLIRIILAGGLLAGGAYLVINKKISLPFAQQSTVTEVTQNIGSQTKVLGERSKEVAGHIQNVLGTAIQKNETDSSKSGDFSLSSVPEKTLEYSQYLYCQQVVKDYENNSN